MALLVPHFFPNYPKESPLNFADYPFAFQLFNVQFEGFMCIVGSRQIAKSTTFAVRQLLNSQLFVGFTSLYIVPRLQQRVTYANRLQEVHRAATFYSNDHRYRQNLNYKEFPNKSVIELAYVLSSDANVRSKSAMEILIDEAAEFDSDLELGVFQAQAATHTPITIYAGTSTTTDSFLAHKDSISSGGEWVMKCPVGHYNIPTMDHGVMEMIQPDGPSCSKCQRLLDVRNGRFYHADQNAFAMGRRGFHIPQLIVPAVVNNPARWAKIYNLKVTGNFRKFQQDVLGIATEEGEREITRKHLMEICTLGSNLTRLHENAANRKYMFVVSGCDWGGSDYNQALHIKKSTTVHCMMGITGTGQFEIIHFQRYEGMNYDDITDDIVGNHIKLKGDAISSDFGVGAVYNSRIRLKIPQECHLIFGYVGPMSALISEPKGDHIYNQWSLNKTESISFVYDAIRQKRIRCYSWEKAEAYLTDCLNMFRAPGETKGESGATTFLYHAHPSKPNDALQAMNYCYTIGKILLGEPMFADVSMALRLRTMLQTAPNHFSSRMPHAISG